ncbi:MAG: hypothetical protein M1580_01435 [Candidatus Parvarchaeota archaeon]|nr:hypothetical protein [Candidatus Parvarchaeota archaeon]
MDNGNNLKQVAQNILDASYKVYSDVSLINSSLFRAASSLGVELPEVPQINLAETKEKTAQSTLTHKVNQTENLSPGKRIPLFGIDKKLKQQQESTEKEVVVHPVLKETQKTETVREQKINKIAHELPSGQNYKPGELAEEKITVAQSGAKTETKVSMEEKEAKLNQIQSAMPSKINIVNKENENVIQPLEAVSPKGELSSQSELQKKIFETTNFGKNVGKGIEDSNEILNNPLNKLLLLVKEKHSITTSQAAQSLNVSKDLIERWAKILSQNSLIRVKYQLMGDMILEG